MLSWRAAFTFPTREPGAVGKLVHAGWWFLLCPPVGWLMALGYRREVALNLVDGRTPVLPAWSGLHLPALGYGLRALGVILSYFRVHRAGVGRAAGRRHPVGYDGGPDACVALRVRLKLLQAGRAAEVVGTALVDARNAGRGDIHRQHANRFNSRRTDELLV